MATDKYYIFKVNPIKDILWGMLIGFPVSFGFALFKLYDSSKGLINSLQEAKIGLYILIYILGFFIGFVIKVIVFNGVHSKIFKADFNGIGRNFFTLIKNLLLDLERPEENKDKLKETSYFLKVNNARTGGMLQFAPDNESINLLHKVIGMLSITQAEPSEWLNPTYNFFLINNYIASLAQSISIKSPVKAIKFSINRQEDNFKNFENEKKQVLKKLSELGETNSILKFLSDNKIFIRFYIVKKEEIENNKSIIETLIAGHDLFGCYLYFVNANVLDNLLDTINKERLQTFIKSVNYNLNENNNKIDLAVASVDSKLNVIYRSKDKLHSNQLDATNSEELKSFIVKLCNLLYSNYEQETHLFNNFFVKEHFIMNNEYCHIYIEK